LRDFKRFLITGGAGFIGSHLVEALVQQDYEVTVLDDLSTGSATNLDLANATGRVNLVVGSVLDDELVAEHLAGHDCCIHLAATVGVKLVIDRPLDMLRRNVRGTQNVLEAAAREDVPVIFASSSEVYGKNNRKPLTEVSDRLLGPTSRARWGYANSKAFGEFMVNALVAEGAEMLTVRLFNTVGPRQTGAYGMVLPTFVSQAVSERPLTVYGDGQQTRCFTHVADTVEAILTLLAEPRSRGRTLNVGSSREISIIELARVVIERAGSGSPIEMLPYEEVYGEGFEELGSRKPDTTAVERLTGWRPRRDLAEIIDDVIAYERAQAVVSRV
jgi:UDP-glucose 4-epimerase